MYVHFSIQVLTISYSTDKGMGMYASTRWSIGSGVVFTFITLHRPLNAIDMLRHLKQLGSSILFISPSLLEDIADGGDEMIVPLKEHSRLVIFGGASLKQSAGNILASKGVPLMTAYGM
jgi:hypothetical protein